MAMAGLYRRLLPSPPAIDFASAEGKQLFIEAIHNGSMEGFYRLISYFQTQSEPAFCGLASLCMVLNALAIDPGRKWKGPWRWFDESMLDCCEPLEKIKANGISFGKVVCLAHCAGAKVQAFRTNRSSLADFRKFLITCSTSGDSHVIASYHRAVFKQTGTGHFSPIGGYHAGRDMALILDVARFKYPPHWVPLKLLWEAMDSVDETTGQHRGFLLISTPHRAPGLLYTLSCKHESWVRTARYLMDEVPILLTSEDVQDIKKALSVVFTSLLSDFDNFIKWIAEVRRQEDGSQSLSQEEKSRLAIKEEVLTQVQETVIYKHVRDFLSSESTCCRNHASSGDEESLPKIAASVCCQGAEFLAGKFGSSTDFFCSETCVKCVKHKGNKPSTVVSGTVLNGSVEQEVDMIVPSTQSKLSCSGSSNCIRMYPASNDVLTVLVLALPVETWHGVKDKKLLQDIYDLVSPEKLPTLLQEEVLHLRQQLQVLKRCNENKVDEDLDAPLF